ncbi:DUF3267 domain-containing protein [Bacillus sp. Marseille-Q3570]|uniref:DUF3267 domain-containing protein n=1 Tax=Bacillus sp. Marseille-Q3570 TaxID=2963522 RepID=UPI0021B7F8CB|nr:DUF3267 domain-containing protein [Bacillus sp. Marseille-Q3570]
MNCYKSINLTRDYGKLRLLLISTLFSLTYFIVYFMVFSMFHPETIYYQTGLMPLMLVFILIIPIHIFLHCLPIWISGHRACMAFGENRFSLFCRIPEVLSRRVALFGVSFPLILITSVSLIGGYMLPEFLHLFAIVSTLNIFLCVKDMIYIIHLWKAPKDSFLEDGATGFQIIVKRTF